MILSEEFKRFGSYGYSDGLMGGLSIGLPVILHFGSNYLKEKLVGLVWKEKSVLH